MINDTGEKGSGNILFYPALAEHLFSATVAQLAKLDYLPRMNHGAAW